MAPAPAPAHSHRKDPVAPYLQQLFHCASEEAAHQREMKIKREVTKLLQAYRLAGSIDRGQRFLGEMRAALAPEMPTLTHRLIGESQEADAAEEIAQTEYLCVPTVANARAWRIKLEHEVAQHYDLILALRLIEAGE